MKNFAPLLLIAILYVACGKAAPKSSSQEDLEIIDGSTLKIENGLILKIEGEEKAPLTGTVVYYYPDGSKKEQLECVDGKWKGKFLWWHENGSKAGEATMIAKGTWDGEYKEWFKNGNLKVQSQFENGVVQGKEVWRHESGQTRSVRNYIDGKKHGSAVGYFNDGKKEWESNWQNGKPHGAYREYEADGSLASVIHYQDGKRHGELKAWFTPDPVKGLPRRLSKQMQFENGMLQGLKKEWWANGKPKLEERYLAGQRDGLCVEWDAAGNEISKLTYSKGELIKSKP